MVKSGIIYAVLWGALLKTCTHALKESFMSQVERLKLAGYPDTGNLRELSKETHCSNRTGPRHLSGRCRTRGAMRLVLFVLMFLLATDAVLLPITIKIIVPKFIKPFRLGIPLTALFTFKAVKYAKAR
ncbi:hypothetical protein MRX96_004133 [Rhipicephalus microplus]